MKKKILSLVLAVLMISVLIPMAAFADSNVAEVNGVVYSTLNEALTAAANETEQDVVITILSDVTENITTRYTFKTNVTITADTAVTVDCGDMANGELFNSDGTTMTIGENVTITDIFRIGPKDANGTIVIDGTVKAQYLAINGNPDKLDGCSTAVINGKVIGIGEGALRTENNSKLIVNGTGKTGAQIEGMYVSMAGTKVATFEFTDAEVQFVSFFDANGVKFDISLNNSKLTVSGGDYSTIEIANALNMDATSELYLPANGAVIIDEGAVANIVPGVKITANSFTNNGTIAVDMTGAAAGNVKVVDYTGTATMTLANYGTIVIPEGYVAKVVDNDLVVAKTVAKIGDTIYTDLAEALNAAMDANVDVTVELLDDIDLASTWTSIKSVTGKSGVVTINGNGKTITGLNAALFESGVGSKSGLVINNLTISGANIYEPDTETGGVAAFIGYLQADQDITLNGCAVVDSTITGGNWGGGLIGAIHGYTPVSVVTIKDCTVSGCTINSNSAGALIGHANQSGDAVKIVIVDTTATNNTIIGEKVGKAGILIGTIGVTGNTPVELDATESGNRTFVSETQIANPTVAGRIGSSGGAMTVTDGSYSVDPTVVTDPETGTVAPKKDFEIKQNADGSYGVEELPDVAKIGDTKYKSLAEAIEAAQSGETVVLVADSDYSFTLPVGVLFDTNGKSYTGTVSAPEGYVVKKNANVYSVVTVAEAELQDTKDAAVAMFKAYVADLKLNDTSFMETEIGNINAAADEAAVAEALKNAKAAADAQKAAEVQAMRDDAIAKVEAALGENPSEKALAIVQEYKDKINSSSDANEIAKLAAEGADKVAYQVECDDEGFLISGIRALVTFTERGNLAQVKKVMGIVKPILGIFGIR